MNISAPWPPDILERMARAVEKVQERLHRTAQALASHGIPYAVIGGNCVAAWVAKIDAGAVRTTRDVDILIRREDLDRAKIAMDTVGFDYAFSYGVHLFVERPDGKPSEGVHLLFAGEKVKATDPIAAPDLAESEAGTQFQFLTLEAIVRMKLVANRDKDRTLIRDLIGVGLIDAAWPEKFPEVLAERLRQILANPEG